MTPAQTKTYFKEKIKAAGIPEPPMLKRYALGTKTIATGFVIIGVAVLARLILIMETKGFADKWTDDISLLTGFVVFSFGYIQWRAGRQEASLDKFYDRLDGSNNKLDAWMRQWHTEAAAQKPPLDPTAPGEAKLSPNEDHLHTMYVFSELDNLEYVLEKYQLGYVTPELGGRALRTFESRCNDSPRFHTCVQHFIGKTENDVVSQGYQYATRLLVRKTCTDCDARKEAAAASGSAVSSRGIVPPKPPLNSCP